MTEAWSQEELVEVTGTLDSAFTNVEANVRQHLWNQGLQLLEFAENGPPGSWTGVRFLPLEETPDFGLGGWFRSLEARYTLHDAPYRLTVEVVNRHFTVSTIYDLSEKEDRVAIRCATRFVWTSFLARSLSRFTQWAKRRAPLRIPKVNANAFPKRFRKAPALAHAQGKSITFVK